MFDAFHSILERGLHLLDCMIAEAGLIVNIFYIIRYI